jgi:hypothetical protein
MTLSNSSSGTRPSPYVPPTAIIEGIETTGSTEIDSIVEEEEKAQPEELSIPSHTVSCYKERSGSGIGRVLRSSWPRRRLVFWPSQHILAYYDFSSDHATNQEPRGVVNLTQQQVDVQIIHQAGKRGTPTPHELHIVIAAASFDTDSDDDDEEIDPTIHTEQRWKLCFDTKEEQMEWLALLHDAVMAQQHDVETINHDFEHNFEAGDHVFRWEMIIFPPVIYPIQIHAICLEAGRNCVILADFGLTGYGKQSGKDFKHSSDNQKGGATDHLQAAWKKFRPKEDQRLNIVTLIDQREIRKWTKANYGRSFFDAGHHKPNKMKKLKSLFGKPTALKLPNVAKNDDGVNGKLELKDSRCESDQEDDDLPFSYALMTESGDNEWLQEGENAEDKQSTKPPSAKASPKKKPLFPKSDPKEIVLARANFLLEFGEDVLPPYHAFYSNSECIAVWCKTGRWSTLQAAIFLTTTSVGAAKSSTLTTLGVVAAHAILAPVVAVGGILWVSAPMIILKKSQVKWEQATVKMTDLFWEWAPPEVFCAAIENWSGLGITE